MKNVANIRRPAPGKPGRHLTVVPDDGQAALWDSSELDRLARLRQLAIETNAHPDAIRLIESATTTDQAIDRLTQAGFMPTESESDQGLMSWFTPLLEPGCDQLEAEACGSEFIGELRRAAPPNLDVTEVLRDLIVRFEKRPSQEALAMMRVLAAVGPVELRAMAANAAAQMIVNGLTDRPWAKGLGLPKPGRCFGYTDIYGEQRSMVTTFSYGRKTHAIVVLIDNLLGGGIKDCYVADYTESLRSEYREIGRDPELTFEDLGGAQARAILEAALSREICPVEPDQVDDVEAFVELLRARVPLLPATGPQAGRTQAGGTTLAKGTPGKRPAVAKNVHRLKVTLRGAKPPVWRRFEVPSDITLQRLHMVIQIGFGWQNSHLHVFETPAGRYGTYDPELEIRSAANKKLSGVADWPGDRFRYEYDFGDSWEHDIVVEAVLPAQPGVAYPRCTAGRRAGPPEDCGGVWGYADLLNVLANPRHEDHPARLWWLGIESADEFDPDVFDRDGTNAGLTRISKVLIKP